MAGGIRHRVAEQAALIHTKDPGLEFVWEDVFQMNFQFYKHRFQFVQSQMMFTMLNAEKSLVRNTDFSCKFRVRTATPFFSQKFCQLLVQIALHI
jgi:hypothetical protein